MALQTRTRIFSSDGGFFAAGGSAASTKISPATRGRASSSVIIVELAANRRQPIEPSPTNLARCANPQTMGGDGNTSQRVMAGEGAATRGGRAFPSTSKTRARPTTTKRRRSRSKRTKGGARPEGGTTPCGGNYREPGWCRRKQRKYNGDEPVSEGYRMRTPCAKWAPPKRW